MINNIEASMLLYLNNNINKIKYYLFPKQDTQYIYIHH